jgi:N-acetylglucosamine-6-sulfatase
MVLKSCKGDVCRDPWGSIHPLGNVKSLADAIEKRFDTFYQKQTKVNFSKCELGYIKDSEGPQDFAIFGEDDDELSILMGESLDNQQPLLVDPDWSIWT